MKITECWATQRGENKIRLSIILATIYSPLVLDNIQVLLVIHDI